MHDSVTEMGARGKNGLCEDVWIECKERVYRKDEHIHVIIHDLTRKGCVAELSHTL